MKIQFSAVRSKLGYKKEDIIKSRFFYEGNYIFLILNHDYGDTISLKMIGYMTSVDFRRVNDVDNFILNNKRHIKFKPLDVNPPRELDIICTPKEEYKNATVYCTSISNIFEILTADDSMFFINGFYYLVIDNDQKYCITFDNDRYVILVDENYKDPSKLPGISFAKLPLEKEQIKNVSTFDNTEDARIFLGKLMNKYVLGEELPESNADICILLRAFRNNHIPISIDLLNLFNIKLISTSDEGGK